MPWELAIIGGYLGGKVLDLSVKKALGLAGESAKSGARVFVETMRKWNQTLAERYLSLQGEKLISFYSKDAPIDEWLGEERYCLPMSMALPSRDGGSLEAQNVSFKLLTEEFRPDPKLDEYRHPVLARAQRDGRLFNGKVVRVVDITPGGIVLLTSACYFDALTTNFAMDHRPKTRRETLRTFLHGGGQSVGAFGGNELVNHLGVVCMVETSDGMLIGQRRSSKVANRSRTLSASVSGALNHADVRPYGQGVFQLSGLVDGVLREAFEELGISLEDVKFLGLVREFLRGGKPELYFYAKSCASLMEVRRLQKHSEGKKESEAIDGFELHSERAARDGFEFRCRVRKILNDSADSANLTFVAGTLLTCRHVLKSATVGARPPLAQA